MLVEIELDDSEQAQLIATLPKGHTILVKIQKEVIRQTKPERLTHEKISLDVDDYLVRGGKITKVERGKSAIPSNTNDVKSLLKGLTKEQRVAILARLTK